ncbi:MAG: PilN domain-containing protein [Zetaproteobacteria bacterium]|nr:MAG: PilN domain-containing protein [Zetaproteobacteria bacterium]
MIRINLIPYRGVRRQRQILQHIAAALGVVGLAVVISLGLHIYGSSTLSGLQSNLASLRAQNKILNKKIGKIRDLDKLRKSVQRKLALVDELQRGRFRSLETLLALSHAIPENVWLLDVKDSGGGLQLNGLGESNKAVANFMRALDQEPVFSGVNLKVIERQTIGSIPVRKFSLKMQRVTPPAQAAKPVKGKQS